MLDDETRDMLLAHARRVRENTSYENHFAPLVVWLDSSDTVMEERRVAREVVSPAIVSSAAQEAFRMRAPTTFLAVDEYYVQGMTKEEMREVTPAEAFKKGDERVTEQLGYTFFYWTQRVIVEGRQAYRWTPADGWEWDEPEIAAPKDVTRRPTS